MIDLFSDNMHQNFLQKYCRICGRKQESMKSLQGKKNFKDLITTILGQDVANDDPCIHPPCICDICRNALGRFVLFNILFNYPMQT